MSYIDNIDIWKYLIVKYISPLNIVHLSATCKQFNRIYAKELINIKRYWMPFLNNLNKGLYESSKLGHKDLVDFFNQKLNK